METILTIKEISLLFGIWVAIYGIDSWRREHKGKRQIELAEETLSLFYEARDAVSFIRNPISYESETDQIDKHKNESEAEFHARRSASIIFVRYRQHNELFNKIKSLKYRFMAQIGDKEAEPFDQLESVVNELFVAARMLSSLWGRKRDGSIYSEEKLQQMNDQIDKYEEIFWEGYGEIDPLTPKLVKSIENLEKICRKVIAGQGSLYSIINKKLS